MRRPALLLALLLLAATTLVWAAPTAILVDTSRSITPQQFQGLKDQLAEVLPSLTAKGEVALYAFNDTADKVVDFTSDSAQLKAGLDEIKQGGKTTLLYDCLFTAVKDLKAKGQGGMVLLVTDGKDVNSATVLEDAATQAGEASVGVVTEGIGSGINVKVLRRISTLTGGHYAGNYPAVKVEDLRDAAEKTMASLRPPAPGPSSAPAQSPTGPGTPAVPPAPGPVPEAERAGTAFPWWLMLLLILLVLAAVVGLIVLVFKRTKPPGERTCQECGRELNLWESECPICLAKKLSITNPGVFTGEAPAAPPIPEIDPALLRKAPSSELLENTIVLDEVPILVLQRGKNPARVFQLPPDQVVSVGRDKVNTISIADQTLSGQHFRIVPKNNIYYLADLQSTNGTFLNGERASLKEMSVGSVIHAGQCDFTFKREQRKLN